MAIITISRGSYSGGKLLAECLGQALGYKIISREFLLQGAEKFGVTAQKLENALESPPKFWEHFSHEKRQYLAIVQAALCDAVRLNNVIYHGYGGHFLLKDLLHLIRVRIIAPLAFRLGKVMEEQELDRGQALQYVQTKDEQRIRWTKFLYGVDWNDPALYDVVINLENMNLECACAMVANLARQKDRQWDAASQESMDNLWLASQVRAALALNPLTANAEIILKAENGVIRLSGLVRNENLIKDVIAVASRVPGVKDVHRYNLQ